MQKLKFGELQRGDIVLVKRYKENMVKWLIGRVEETDYEFRKEKHVVIWGNWCEEKHSTGIRDIYEFRTHFGDEPGLEIIKLGKWLNGEIKNRLSEALYLLHEVLLSLKSRGDIPLEMITRIMDFLGVGKRNEEKTRRVTPW